LGDVYKHAWSYSHLLAEGGNWPHSTWLNAPAGGVLLDVMLGPAVLMAPVGFLAGPVVAANLWVWLSFFAIGACTAALAHALFDSEEGGLLAGLLAQQAPYLAGYPLFSGVHERLAAWFFPLLLLCAWRLREGAGRKWGLLALASAVLVTFSCAVYALWGGLLLLFCLPLLLRGEDGAGARRLLPWGLGYTAVLGLGYAVARMVTYHPQTLSPQPGRLDLGLGVRVQEQDVASLGELLNPFTVSAQQPVDSGDQLLEICYLSWVLICVAIWGLRSLRGSRVLRILLGVGGLFALLSMGAVADFGLFQVPNLPYLLLAWLVPMYGRIPVPFQQLALVTPLLALGAAAWISTLAPTRRMWAVGVVFALCLFERALVLPVGVVAETAPATPSTVYEDLEEGNLVVVPRMYRNRFLASGKVFLAQTAHRRPQPVSIHLGVTAWDAYAPVLYGQSEDWESSLRCLARGGFRWLAVHGDWFAEGEAAAQVTAIEQVLGSPGRSDGDTYLFDLSLLGEPLASKRFLAPFSPQQGPEGAPTHAPQPVDEGSEEMARVVPGCPVDSRGPGG
jgi:hypothetical protein